MSLLWISKEVDCSDLCRESCLVPDYMLTQVTEGTVVQVSGAIWIICFQNYKYSHTWDALHRFITATLPVLVVFDWSAFAVKLQIWWTTDVLVQTIAEDKCGYVFVIF